MIRTTFLSLNFFFLIISDLHHSVKKNMNQEYEIIAQCITHKICY